MRVRNLALEDTGTYTCIVMNDEEKVEDTVSIQVTPFGKFIYRCIFFNGSFKKILVDFYFHAYS